MHVNFLFLTMLILILSCSSKDEQEESAVQPNILFLIADDWSYPHAGAYGDRAVKTPTFDFLAKSGALFTNAYCAAPSCSPSRASILTSLYPHQLESAGNLWSVFPSKFANWASILNEAGYHTGKMRKGWGPGDFIRGGYQHNPAGQNFNSFQEFLEAREDGQSFYFWFGSSDPHRIYETNTGVVSGMKHEEIKVPGFLPDVPCVRNDMMDYYFEIERFDRECGQLIHMLDELGELENTLIVMTSDNGMPFPRAKANLYDYGTRMPLAMYWKGMIDSGNRIEDFVSFVDFGPTFLDAAKQNVPSSFSGRSVLPLFDTQRASVERDHVFIERERHANVRLGDLSYPCRAVRNAEYLYIRNFEPDRWPGGDPEAHKSVGQYGDVDNSISKYLIMAGEGSDPLFDLAFSKRPAEELYSVIDDPYNLVNLANDPSLQTIKEELQKMLSDWMSSTGDLRFHDPQTNYWDTVEYTPVYDHENFDLESRIAMYRMKVPDHYNNFEEVGCLTIAESQN